MQPYIVMATVAVGLTLAGVFVFWLDRKNPDQRNRKDDQ